MKIKFNMTDEVTITNTTVKISAWIQGVVNGQDRPALEAAALELAKKLFPEVSWAFSNFTYQPDGFTFRVQASTRIDATQNDQLALKCDQLSEQGKLTIAINNIDASIPLHEKRKAESDLRVALIEKAKAEAEKLSGTVTRIEFGEAIARDIMSNARGASYAASAMMLESTSKGGGSDGVSLGHSEKIYLEAQLTVKVG
jgi:hypothetical protein